MNTKSLVSDFSSNLKKKKWVRFKQLLSLKGISNFRWMNLSNRVSLFFKIHLRLWDSELRPSWVNADSWAPNGKSNTLSIPIYTITGQRKITEGWRLQHTNPPTHRNKAFQYFKKVDTLGCSETSRNNRRL